MEAFAPRAKGRSWLDNGMDASVADLNPNQPQLAPTNNEVANVDGPASKDEEGPAADDVQPSTMSDLDWMRARMKKTLDDESPAEKVFIQDDSDMEDAIDQPSGSKPPEPPTGAPTEDSHPPPVMQTRRLFLRNLAYVCTEDEIRAEFSRFGAIEQVRFILIVRSALLGLLS
jgi:multiple RNA-binding domain-containing protein 1